jgi:L-amino acid N-acyltransferase YncA
MTENVPKGRNQFSEKVNNFFMSCNIQSLTPKDWPDVERIYAEGIATGIATFEIATPTWEKWDAGHLQHSRLVAVSNGLVVGWTALNPISARQAYAGVAEHSIYISSTERGKGVGKILLNALVESSEQNGIWTVQSTVFTLNTASLALHRACGFREVGIRERIANRNGVWYDTFLIERRSRTVGV